MPVTEFEIETELGFKTEYDTIEYMEVCATISRSPLDGFCAEKVELLVGTVRVDITPHITPAQHAELAEAALHHYDSHYR